jgi:hypothetical protein
MSAAACAKARTGRRATIGTLLLLFASAARSRGAFHGVSACNRTRGGAQCRCRAFSIGARWQHFEHDVVHRLRTWIGSPQPSVGSGPQYHITSQTLHLLGSAHNALPSHHSLCRRRLCLQQVAKPSHFVQRMATPHQCIHFRIGSQFHPIQSPCTHFTF